MSSEGKRKKREDEKEKAEVLRRLRALEARVGAVRKNPETARNYDTAKEEVKRRLEYLQKYAEAEEGIQRWS